VEESEDLRRATALWRAAYRYQMEGELDQAVEHYQRSVAVHPTAEAHTFLGWSLSFQGRLEEATAECLRAIEIDPDFGNPYNDIGVYLMQQGKLDEAIPWLGKAKQARRYEPRQFPFMNLGRVYLKQGGRASGVRGSRAGGSGRRACREDASSAAWSAELT
jgi:Tfp pilus assembly protein PilF